MELTTDEELANVAAVSAGNNSEIGDMISRAMQKVGRQGVVTMEESRTAEDSLYVVEGMQFERGYMSPYFVTDPERMIAEYENCRLLLVDKKITSAREIVGILEACIRGVLSHRSFSFSHMQIECSQPFRLDKLEIC